MPPVAFRCPLCESAFQVAAEHQGQAVACPHCGQAVAIPPPSPPSIGPADSPEGTRPAPPGRRVGPAVHVVERTKTTVELDGQSYEVRVLTPQERAKFRRRVNACIFGVAAALLAIVVAVLLLLRG